MKRTIIVFLTVLLCLTICGCGKIKVTFDYNCPGLDNYICNVNNNKLDCNVNVLECNNEKFVGWFDKKENGNIVDLNGDFNNSITLYAHWEKTNENDNQNNDDIIITISSQINFNTNGGTGGPKKSIEIEDVEKQTTIGNDNPTRDGYTFMGWYDSPDYEKGELYYDETGKLKVENVSEGVTLYAGWQANEYTVTFDLNGGNSYEIIKPVSVRYDEYVPTVRYIIPTRSGYTFMGWYDNKDYTKGNPYYDYNFQPFWKYDIEGDTTLYAGWSKLEETSESAESNKSLESNKALEGGFGSIWFSLNGGESNERISPVYAIYNEIVPQVSYKVPTRNGYIFVGWYDNKDYTKGKLYYDYNFQPVGIYSVKKNLTLYAGWEEYNSKIVSNVVATCTGGYENGYGLATLNVNISKGFAINYKFISDNKTIQNSTSSYYKSTSNYTLLINPKVEITNILGNKTIFDCNVNHSDYITYNKKGYYFSKKASKDKTKAVVNPYNKNNIPYYLYVGPNVSSTEKLPLIIALHGGYGYECSGKDLNERTQNNHYLKKALYYREELINNEQDGDIRAVVLAPSNVTCNWDSSMYKVIEIMYAIIKLYNIDLDNIVVTGNSQGGFGTLFLGFLEEHITYIPNNNNTTLESIANMYGTTAAEVKDYNEKIGRTITYSDRKRTKLKTGNGVIIRAKNDNDQRSLFSVLIPMSPAKAYTRCSFTPSTIYDTQLDSEKDDHKCSATPPYDLKTPIWVISSNDENHNIIDFSKELAAYYQKRGNIRYTTLNNLPSIGISKHYTQNAIIGRTSAINWMLKQKYGEVDVVNDSELDLIEASLGSNFAGVWNP